MRHVALVVLVGVLAACGPNAAETVTPPTTTVAVEEPPTTTTTTVEATTTTVEATTTTVEATTTTVVESVDICRRGTVWEPGAVYVTDCFFAPVAFAPVDEGWRSVRANEQLVWGFWVEPGSTSPTAHYLMLAYEARNEPAAVLDSLTSIEGVNPTSARFDLDLDGVAVTMVDLETDPVEDWVYLPSGDLMECSSSEAPFTNIDYPGYELLSAYVPDFAGPSVYQLDACRQYRVWVLDGGDVAVTVVWTPDDPDRFDELVPMADRLVDSMTFEVP